MWTLNLDTGRISDLVREPDRADCRAVLELLECGSACLVITHGHLVELTDERFTAHEEVVNLLRGASHVIAQPLEQVSDEEVAVAIARIQGFARRPVLVFARSTLNWGTSPTSAEGNAADLLRAYRNIPAERASLVAAFERWARAAQHIRHQAAIVRDPAKGLINMVDQHLVDRRLRLPDYAARLTAEEIVDRAGGREAFPLTATSHAMLRQRLKEPTKRHSRNDMLDEEIAAYAPYVALTVHDAGAAHRLRRSELPWSERVTRQLQDVPTMLARLEAGELPLPEISTTA